MKHEIFINFIYMNSQEIQKQSDFWRTIGLILIGLSIGYLIGRFELTSISFENKNNKNLENKSYQIAENSTQKEDKEISINTQDEPTLGSNETTVKIIDFSDYQCPFCKKFYSEILPQLKTDYIDTGKISYTFKDFPLNIHKKAQYAHYAANCANDQNKYWEMHDTLFDKQKEWEESNDTMETFISYAKEIGLNTTTFSECLTSEKYQDEILKDKEEGIKYGVKGTPTFIINGKIIRGINSYENLKQLIEKEL